MINSKNAVFDLDSVIDMLCSLQEKAKEKEKKGGGGMRWKLCSLFFHFSRRTRARTQNKILIFDALRRLHKIAFGGF